MNWLKRLIETTLDKICGHYEKKQCINCRYWCNGGNSDVAQEWGTCLKDKPGYVFATRPEQWCDYFIFMDNDFVFIKK